MTPNADAGAEESRRLKAGCHECDFGGPEVSGLLPGRPPHEGPWKAAPCRNLLHTGTSVSLNDPGCMHGIMLLWDICKCCPDPRACPHTCLLPSFEAHATLLPACSALVPPAAPATVLQPSYLSCYYVGA